MPICLSSSYRSWGSYSMTMTAVAELETFSDGAERALLARAEDS
jgi:hypothetical protein